MLNIKLPAGEVARALAATAQDLEDQNRPLKDTYLTLPASNEYHHRAKRAALLREWNLAAENSIGDVYISAELWSEIKDKLRGAEV